MMRLKIRQTFKQIIPCNIGCIVLNESQKWNVSNYDDLVAAEKELAVLEKPYIEITSAVNATADYMHYDHFY